MLTTTHPARLLALPALLSIGAALVGGGAAQSAKAPRPFLRPLDGTLVLVGTGGAPDCVVDAFVHVAGGTSRAFVVIAAERKSDVAGRLAARGARDVTVLVASGLVASGREWRRDDDALRRFLGAGGVWLEPLPDKLLADDSLAALLGNTLARGGAVAAEGASAAAVSEGTAKRRGLGLLATSRVEVGEPETPGDTAAAPLLQWRISPRTAALVHSGRRIGAYGEGDVALSIARHREWPARAATIDAIDVFDVAADLPYGEDLLAWQRSADERRGPRFPVDAPERITLAKGALVLHGGGGVDDTTFRRFLQLAGGDAARVVCIPSAQQYAPDEVVESYSAGRLRDLGCERVRVVHADDPRVADGDAALLAALDEATGVWIDGGRTFRFMDRFGGTAAATRLEALLARGGVVGGSSAGCQVAGEFLVRGDPRSNRTLVLEGTTRGLGLLPGVALDAHFRQRDRGSEFAALVGTLPGYLGVGVDEDTAVLVQGSTAEVLGANAVTFYDQRAGGALPLGVELKPGARYDLAARRALE